MSDVAQTPLAAPVATEPTTIAPNTDVVAPVTTEATPTVVEPVTETEVKDAAAEDKKPEEAEKAVEPITEGELAYKGPGLLKSLIPSKKEFWLSDEAVTPQHLDLYMRGEKPDVSNPVVAWASQTGKGLLFFNKKGDNKREHPQSVLPLYEAVDLKKSAPHEISFKIHGHPHTLKASNDAERDGWFLSIEKAVELGKAQKETIRESEGYKAEIEKLSKPNTATAAAGGAAGAGVLRSKSKAKKEEETPRAGSDGEDENKKARSTSRGILGRFKSQKEEAKKETVETPEKDAVEADKKAEETEAPAVAAAPLDAPATAERVVAAPVEGEPATEAPTADAAAKAEEKPKASKRGSIFGKMQAFGSMRSPAKEKDQKEAELKPEGAKEEVSEAAPQIPESTVEPAVAADIKPETAAATDAEAVSHTQQKGGFLSTFMKRGRSASPSTKLNEAAKAETETPETVAAAAEGETVAAPTTTEEAKVAEAEEAKTETPVANKRQSMLGNLGRRASKALKGMQAPKKESAAPAAAAEKQEEKAAETAPAVAAEADKPVEVKAPEETEKAQIGDVVPEAVNIGQPQAPATVTASA